jgi:GNAT superfamily N-acetyltransferase
MKIGRRVLRTRLGVDLAVHPDFQNMGIMKGMRALSREAFAGTFDVGYGTTGSPIARRHDVQRGNQPLANAVEVLEHPLGSGATRPGGGPGRGGEDKWMIDQPPEFDDRIDQFWKEASQPFELIVVRTKDYLNWRYCDPRAGAFTVRLAEHGERILGYAVLRVSRGKAYIADLLALPEREDVARSLVRDALGYFRRARVSPVRCWLPSHHPYREVLLQQGFLPKQRMDGLRYTAYGRPKGFLNVLSDPRALVHVTLGDTDLA